MEFLGKQEKILFLGQAVQYAGTSMTTTLKNVPENKKIELPVCEDLQVGISNGLALDGWVPVSIFPRWDFLIVGMNQLTNHLDRLIELGDWKPKVIIRVGVGSVRPLDPHCQHKNDYTEGFKSILRNIEVIKLDEPEQIFPAYKKAYFRDDGKSTLIVEVSDHLNEK